MRPLKDGLDYFPLDTSLDDSFELIEAKYGIEGFGILIKLYQKIYKDHGYFYPWTEREQLLFSKHINVDINRVNAVIKDAVSWGLFDKERFENLSVLTSHGIQKRYIEACGRRKELTLYQDILFDDIYAKLHEKQIIASNNEVIVDIKQTKTRFMYYNSTQIEREREIEKENNNKYTPSAVAEAPHKESLSEVNDDKNKDLADSDAPIADPDAYIAKNKKRKTSTALIPKVENPETQLYHKIQQSFESVFGQFANYGKEGAAIKRIIKLTNGEEPAIQKMIECYLSLIHGQNRFWQGQPFTPSALVAVWDRVKVEAYKDIASELLWANIMEAKK